eukprot:358296-Chlamydomonas_euryale.AAC.3
MGAQLGSTLSYSLPRLPTVALLFPGLQLHRPSVSQSPSTSVHMYTRGHVLRRARTTLTLAVMVG